MKTRKWNIVANGSVRLLAASALCAALLAGVAAPSAWGQDKEAPSTQPEAKDLPKAEKVLDNYVEVTGGKAAYEKLNTSIIKGTIGMPAMQFEGEFVAYSKAPNKSHFVFEIEGMGKTERGTDGDVAWETSDIQGARILEGDEKAEFMRETLFNATLHWRKVYKSAETTGVETINEKPCYRLKLVTENNQELTAFLEKDSGYLARINMTAQTAMGEIPVEAEMSEYSKEGDILMPHKTVQKITGMEQIITIKSIEWNAKIPAEQFELPDAIKELMNKEPAETP